MDKIAAFDTLYTNNHIQICKLLLPSLPKDKQYLFAVFIKFWELHYVITCGKSLLCHPDCDSCTLPDYQALCKEVLPYCSPKEAGMVHKILQILGTIDTVKSLSPLLDLMKQMQAASDDSGSDASSAMPDISSLLQMGDLLGGNGNPELFGMFESFLHAADAGGGSDKTDGRTPSETTDEKA